MLKLIAHSHSQIRPSFFRREARFECQFLLMKIESEIVIGGGVDGTRTRDPRLDRPEFYTD